MNWNFKMRDDRQYKYEAYYSPQGPEMHALYKWCIESFGPIGVGWDNHGGWIKLRDDESLTMFLLRWA